MSSSKKKASKKATPKKAIKRRSDVITPDHLTPASYNPRAFDESSRSALKASMKKFSDISGITWNKQTGNIVTGHHRWETLIDTYGKENLEFDKLSDNRYAIKADGEDTEFTLRVVDWTLTEEKAANVSANSQSMTGRFTADLQDVLKDIQLDFDMTEFEELRLDDLAFDIGGTDIGEDADSDDDGEWHSNIEGVKKTESNLDGIITTIKVDVPQELRSEIFGLLSKTLAESKYSDKAKIK